MGVSEIGHEAEKSHVRDVGEASPSPHVLVRWWR
jgi:hypothetical protein